MQGAKCAISKLMYDLSVCTDDNHLLKLVAFRLVHTDEPYINLHVINRLVRGLYRLCTLQTNKGPVDRLCNTICVLVS